MRTNRLNRQSLKQELVRLNAENTALKELLAKLTEQLAPETNVDTAARGESAGVNEINETSPAPVIIGKGFPTRAKPLRAKSLSEAKAILLSRLGEW